MQKSTGAPWHSPDVSFRGAKRRGNLAVPWWITGRLWRKRNCLPEIATSAVGLLAMTRQGGAVVHQSTSAVECPLLGAQGTPLQVPSEAIAVLMVACANRQYNAGRGIPLPYDDYWQFSYFLFSRFLPACVFLRILPELKNPSCFIALMYYYISVLNFRRSLPSWRNSL